MEKRRKLIYADGVPSNSVNDSSNMDDSNEKTKTSFSPTLILISLVTVIALYYSYLTMQGSNKNLPSLTVHLPSFHEDINIHIPSIQKDAFPVIEQINLQSADLSSENDIVAPGPNELQIQANVDRILGEMSKIKIKHVAIEDNPIGLQLKLELQDELRKLIPMRYGPPPYLVEMKLQFPETMPDYATDGPYGVIIIKLAPIELIPYSVYTFLEIVRNWKSGSFHRNAGHVLQTMITTTNHMDGLVFQEYHPSYPHVEFTMGYAGRPGGPPFYISTIDNTRNHGLGSQGSKGEADSCFGKILVGEDVVKRMRKQPGGKKPHGFIESKKDFINITSMKLLDNDPAK